MENVARFNSRVATLLLITLLYIYIINVIKNRLMKLLSSYSQKHGKIARKPNDKISKNFADRFTFWIRMEQKLYWSTAIIEKHLYI